MTYSLLYFFLIESSSIIFFPLFIDLYSCTFQECCKLPSHIMFYGDECISLFLEFFQSLVFEREEVGIVKVVYFCIIKEIEYFHFSTAKSYQSDRCIWITKKFWFRRDSFECFYFPSSFFMSFLYTDSILPKCSVWSVLVTICIVPRSCSRYPTRRNA